MIVGEANVDRDMVPTMGGEDFAFMLEERPGAFIFAGVGENVANLHNESYDFNDELIPCRLLLLDAAGRNCTRPGNLDRL